jgi:hypothetical protein
MTAPSGTERARPGLLGSLWPMADGTIRTHSDHTADGAAINPSRYRRPGTPPARLGGAFVRQNPGAGLHDVEVRRLLPRAQGRVRRQPRLAGEDVVADVVHRWHGYLYGVTNCLPRCR